MDIIAAIVLLTKILNGRGEVNNFNYAYKYLLVAPMNITLDLTQINAQEMYTCIWKYLHVGGKSMCICKCINGLREFFAYV